MGKLELPCERCGHSEPYYTGDGDIEDRCGVGLNDLYMKTDSVLCKSFKPTARIPAYAIRLYQIARLSGLIGWAIVAIILILLLFLT